MNTLLTGNQMRDITRNLGRGNAEIALCRAQEAYTKRMMVEYLRDEAVKWESEYYWGILKAAKILEEK